MKKLFTYTISVIPSLLLAVIILVIPQLNNSELMDPTQSGKAFGFLWGMLGYLVVLLFIFTINRQIPPIRITLVDILLGVFCLMEVISYCLHPGDPLQMLIIGALVLFYLSVRAINLKNIVYLLIAVVISGTIQAIYGNLQLWGYFMSNHSLFKMTGSFFNPGPFAGYLAAVFPVSLGFYLFNIQLSFPNQNLVFIKLNSYLILTKSYFKNLLSKTHYINKNDQMLTPQEEQTITKKPTNYTFLKSLALLSIISMGMVLPASRSRAAWLAVSVSSVYLITLRYQLVQKLRIYLNTLTKKSSLIGVLIIFLAISMAGLYHFKKGSADGRLLIWKVSAGMIKDNPILGHGVEGFKSHYMDYQAAYFKNNPDSKDAMVAGDTNYAFNEFIQLTVENGLVGLLLIVTIILLLFFKNNKNNNPEILGEEGDLRRAEGYIELNSETSWIKNEHIEYEQFLLHISRAVILSIIVFGLFSYPLQILPIKICLVIVIAIAVQVLNLKGPEIIKQFNYSYNLRQFALKSILSVGCLGVIWMAISYMQQVKVAYTDWKYAFDTYNMGIYDDCLIEYQKAFHILKTNGDFLTNYGKALSMADKHVEAIEKLQQAAKYYPNTVVYTTLGDSYKEIGRTELAEKNYNYAWNMNPGRFYPKYLLVKLYIENGQKRKAVKMAEELLEKEVKIKSTAIQEIKDEMKKIIGK